MILFCIIYKWKNYWVKSRLIIEYCLVTTSWNGTITSTDVSVEINPGKVTQSCSQNNLRLKCKDLFLRSYMCTIEESYAKIHPKNIKRLEVIKKSECVEHTQTQILKVEREFPQLWFLSNAILYLLI